MEAIQRLKKMIDESNRIVFFGGAGVPTESGIPDFRSKDGLYNQHDIAFENYEPEYLLSHTCLYKEPKVFFEFFHQKLDTRAIQPNAAHKYLAQLETTTESARCSRSWLHWKTKSRMRGLHRGTSMNNDSSLIRL